jgi:O-glycosyl hydrolase
MPLRPASLGRFRPASSLPALILALAPLASSAQRVTIDASAAGQQQVIDGFGTCLTSDSQTSTAWWQQSFLDDLGASILRVDLVPRFKSPYRDHGYVSPWFRGRGAPPYALNFEIDSSHSPRHYTGPAANEFVTVNGATYYNGPEGNRARTYTGPADYGRPFGGFQAPIAVMGPNIDDNIARAFPASLLPEALAVINAARQRDPALNRFKLTGSIWSPAPWLKVSSGNVTGSNYGAWPFAATGTPFPYIAVGGNFVGGRLDVSETPHNEFNDSALPADVPGGPNAQAARGPTSALTQFARSTAAYVRAIQNELGLRFYSLSIQNELNFETFYNSCTYPLSSQYIKAVRYVRAEFDKYDDLRGIKIMGPEDLLADSSHSLWQYGGGTTTVHKNLRYVQDIEADPQAAQDVAFYCIHGYAADGASSAGADPVAWDRWARGWTTPPAAGIPANVKGFTPFNKKSWMTETSGESPAWRHPATGFPNDGAFSIALKIHQALTTGRQSAWVYWQFTDGANVGASTLTDHIQRSAAPKFNAARHYFRYIRPGAIRHTTQVAGSTTLLASSYVHPQDQTLTVVLVNTSASAQTVTLERPAALPQLTQWEGHVSSDGALWQGVSHAIGGNGETSIAVPGYGVVSVVATTSGAPVITEPPQGFTLAPGSSGLLHVSASGGGGMTYQWHRNGAAIAGATASSYTVHADANGAQAEYHVVLSNAHGTVTSESITVRTGDVPRARLFNLSVRTTMIPGQTALIVGFNVHGGSRQLLSRAIGPGLTPFGLTNVLADPMLDLYDANRIKVDGNEDWGGGSRLLGAFARGGAFGITPDSKDAALLHDVSGVRTLHCEPRTGGIVIVEVYDVGSGDSPRLTNLSARNRVGSKEEDFLIAGFVIAGSGEMQVLIRAVGPRLSDFDVPNVLTDPLLVVYDRDRKEVARNDNWPDGATAAQFARVGAFSLEQDLKSAALVMTVKAGELYTVHVSDMNRGPGEALIEVYELPNP